MTHSQIKAHLSVIIPTLNEIAYSPHLLDALAMQTRLQDEIIVADAGSKDGTAELAQSRCVHAVHGGMPAVGSNAGARAANVFTDHPTDFPSCSRFLHPFEAYRPRKK